MKVVAFDLGDRWTGCAISDALRIIAKPYKTVPADQIELLIDELIKDHKITTIVIGCPITMRGTESDQTRKVIQQKEFLAAKYPKIDFILLDERLSSQRAAALGHAKTKEEKLKSHARAAAFILEIFLQSSKNVQQE